MLDKTRFLGPVAPAVCPCTETDELDWPALERNFERLAASGVTGLYINGGTGDAANLTQEERLAVAEYMVPRLKAAGKLAIVHVGQTTQREAVALARQAAELGADAIASIPSKKDWPQIAEYYRALASAGLPVIVYYIPGVTGMTAGMAQLRTLLDIPGVEGIKMSDWNIFLMHSVCREYPEKVVYSGFDEMFVPGLLYGADGCIGTWMNLVPDLYAKVYARVRDGQADSVRAAMDEFNDFLAVGWDYGILDAFEELMRAKGYAQRCFRRPSAWNPGKLPKAALDDMLARLSHLETLAAEL